MKYYFVSILIIIIAWFLLLIISNKVEGFSSSHYVFLTKEDTKHFFYTDKDNYFQKLTPLDIKAQKSKSKADYKKKMIDAAIDFTPSQKKILHDSMKQADTILSNITLKGFDGMKAKNLPWKIALTKGNIYEDGMPHTRLDTIFISDILFELDKKQLVKTMLHEKVHVYERLFPKDMQLWIHTNGFKPFKKWKSYKRARSNPDIDEWVYLSPEGKPMLVEYTSEQPNSLHDVTYPKGHSYKTEHPNEALAYQLERYVYF